MDIIYKGLFLTKESSDLLFHRRNTLVKIVDHFHITFEFRPIEGFSEEFLGKEYEIKVIGEGNNGFNHGYEVELPEEILSLYSGAEKIHITVSLEGGAKAVETKNLEFIPIEPFYVRGKLGHFTNFGIIFR